MKPYTNNNNLDRPQWERGLDRLFLARVLRPFHQPGVTSTAVQKHIFSRLEQMTKPQSLTGDIFQRHGLDTHRLQEATPIIYVTPAPPRFTSPFHQGDRPEKGNPEGQSTPAPTRHVVHPQPIVPRKVAMNSSSIKADRAPSASTLHIGEEPRRRPPIISPLPPSEQTLSNTPAAGTVGPASTAPFTQGASPSHPPMPIMERLASLSGNGTGITADKRTRHSSDGQATSNGKANVPTPSANNSNHTNSQSPVLGIPGNLQPSLRVHEHRFPSQPVARPLVKAMPLTQSPSPMKPNAEHTQNIPGKPVVREMPFSRTSHEVTPPVLPRVIPFQPEPGPHLPLRMKASPVAGRTSPGPRQPSPSLTAPLPSRIEMMETQAEVVELAEPDQPESARTDLDAIVEKVQRQLRRRLQVETERRGIQPWP